ncbi:MAG TPA: DUF3168 domain-containing protein [Sphingomicrobium sp.]|nr:DUF3168 domain-containing protein [Sphingomicrobium sp.]
MSAGGALQTELAAALQSVGEISGVYDGPPARAPFPYVVVDAGTESDWSHKSGEGREVLAAVTVWDDQPARLHDLADQVETRVRTISTVEGWQLASLRLIRRRTVRDVAGPWAAAIDFRARMLAEQN